VKVVVFSSFGIIYFTTKKHIQNYFNDDKAMLLRQHTLPHFILN
jgi:hypothetical protein